MSRANLILVALALAAAQAHADDVDPEPPPDRAKSLVMIAKGMDDLAKRLKGASAGDETQRLQERILALIDEALRREKARAAKAPRERAELAPALEKVRAMQQRIAADMKRADKLKRGGKKRDAELLELSEEQVKVAQMLRDVAARCKPAR